MEGAAPDELERQVEAAFQFRGHATIHLKDGTSVVGYVYNRELTNPRLRQDRFVDVLLQGRAEDRRYPLASIARLELTGEDHAAASSGPGGAGGPARG